MNISLPPELEAFVDKEVKSGRYTSASEVVRDAVRLLEERDRLNELRIRQLVDAGVAELDAGLGVPLEMNDLKAKARKQRAIRVLKVRVKERRIRVDEPTELVDGTEIEVVLWNGDERGHRQLLDSLRRGLADAKAGRVTDMNDFLDELESQE